VILKCVQRARESGILIPNRQIGGALPVQDRVNDGKNPQSIGGESSE